MLYAPHFLTGAVVMKFAPNPAIGILLGVISHIVLDLMPHNDFDIKPGITLKEFLNMNKKRRNFIIGALSIDAIFAAIAFFWLYFTFDNIWLNLGGIAGVLPDLVEQSLMLFGIALPGWQDKLQFRVSAKYGFIYYPVITILTVYLLLKS